MMIRLIKKKTGKERRKIKDIKDIQNIIIMIWVIELGIEFRKIVVNERLWINRIEKGRKK